MSAAKKQRKGLGITARTTLLSWLITLVTLLIFVGVIVPQQKRFFEQNLEARAVKVAAGLYDATTAAAETSNYTNALSRCKEALATDKSVAYLLITRNDGYSWVCDRNRVRSFAAASSRWHPEVRQPDSGIDFIPVFGKRFFNYSQPFDVKGKAWGWLHVGLTLEGYDQEVAGLYRRTGLLGLSCILFSLIASLLYARNLVRPLLALQKVVQQVTGGDLSVRAPINRSDELGHLAGSVNLMSQALQRRDMVVQNVRFVAQKLLSFPRWQDAVEKILSKIGETTGASRVYLFENLTEGRTEPADFFAREWVAEGIRPQCKNPELKGDRWFAPKLNCARDLIGRGEIVIRSPADFRAEDRQFFIEQNLKSLVLAPIMVEGSWWGFLGVDECVADREWTDAELDSLRAVADMVGATIARSRVEDALLEAKNHLEQRVEERTSELHKQIEAKAKANAELAQAQERLIEASRQAGMAEVATGVLHNVGNVLNSINVSATIIRENLGKSEVPTLGKVAQLLNSHSADLPSFLTADPKGKMIPGFLQTLAEQLQTEHAQLEQEQEQLARNIEHIKQIVSMQQDYAKVSGVLEQVSVATLVDDVLGMSNDSLTRHGIVVSRKYAEVPPVMVDRHKVVQILVNLVQNAKQAMDETNTPEKQLTLGIRNGGGRVKVYVQDTGVGIPPENLTKIFNHGFTTRKQGHGFGLHSGANAAKEMGGELKVQSEGPGKGATFTLELPLTAERKKL